ncbi:MAG: hypothetical protein KDN22_16800 [Verrucomicrobiae bacterium]|nr:hypothetical protein [Verrucomicrobiae bacterium]
MKSAADVTVTVSGLDASEGQLSGDTFTFTPEDWGRQQALTITGVDDPDPDGDSTYNLTFTLTTDDTSYANLSTTDVAVVNVGDEPLPPIGPVILSKLPVTTADGSFLLTATGLEPDAVYPLESSDTHLICKRAASHRSATHGRLRHPEKPHWQIVQDPGGWPVIGCVGRVEGGAKSRFPRKNRFLIHGSETPNWGACADILCSLGMTREAG